MVRLITVIGHGVNLLPHFIKHYKRYVDEINIAIYKTDLYPTLEEDINEIIKDHDNVKIVKVIEDRVFDWEKVTALYNFIKIKHPNDWWVIADIDEFHLYPNDDINTLLSDCDEFGWEIVRGGFIDRIGRGGEFSELKTDMSILKFPRSAWSSITIPSSLANERSLNSFPNPISELISILFSSNNNIRGSIICLSVGIQ